MAGTAIEEILPIGLRVTDDRAEFPQGVTRSVATAGGQLPHLLGYNRVSLEAGGELVAAVGSDPLIACGRFGKGRTVAFTSDCAPHWAPEAFVSWEGYGRLWQQIVSRSAGLI